MMKRKPKKVANLTFFARLNKPNSIHGSNVLHHNLQLRESLDQRLQNCVDKNFLAIKNVNFRICDLSMNLERKRQKKVHATP